MVAKLRTSLGVTPIVSAIFANSSLADGKAERLRLAAAAHLAAHGSGSLRAACPSRSSPASATRTTSKWALDVPMFFVVRDGRYTAMHGKTFRRFLTRGHDGERATLADWNRHLTTLFPDVRAEARDRGARRGLPAAPIWPARVPALWKGLLYDAGARRGGLRAGRRLELARRARGGLRRRGAPRSGGGGQRAATCSIWRRSSLALAREGLARAIAPCRPRREATRRALLEPVAAQLERGKSPGQVVLERWEGEWGRSPDRLIEYARY